MESLALLKAKKDARKKVNPQKGTFLARPQRKGTFFGVFGSAEAEKRYLSLARNEKVPFLESLALLKPKKGTFWLARSEKVPFLESLALLQTLNPNLGFGFFGFRDAMHKGTAQVFNLRVSEKILSCKGGKGNLTAHRCKQVHSKCLL